MIKLLTSSITRVRVICKIICMTMCYFQIFVCGQQAGLVLAYLIKYLGFHPSYIHIVIYFILRRTKHEQELLSYREFYFGFY